MAYIALGSNLGDRFQNLQRAVRHLRSLPEVEVTAVSPVYESAAHTLPPHEGQPAYLNAVAEVSTMLTPRSLLDECLKVEQAMGRTRVEHWSPRVIDLDLIVFGSIVTDEPELRLPHPRLAERRFVLQPLADLAPDLFVPAPHSTTVYSLLKQTPDRGGVRRCDRALSPA